MSSLLLKWNALLMVILMYSVPVWAADRVVIADFSSVANGSTQIPGWQVNEKSGKADFKVIRDGDLAAVLLKSSNTSFSLQKEVKIDLKQDPILTWKWKVTKLPEKGDFRHSSTDDQAAQLFLAFSKTKAIVYLWDTTAPEGTMASAEAPFFMSIKAVVVRSGKAGIGSWITETRNVYDDYKKLFGGEPDEVKGVRLQINSQHTGTSAESYFADVAFQKQ